jgi:hypothetical protein
MGPWDAPEGIESIASCCRLGLIVFAIAYSNGRDGRDETRAPSYAASAHCAL